MPDILADADVALSLFVDLKPMWANSANKFFDALASGTPVAINYRGWQADLLEETGAGIILPPDDPDKAAAMLAAFVADKKILQKAGQAARNLAEERFSRDKLAGQLERVLVSTLP
jgi:glycosyltransferase involved in cell wall biosynthesis